MPSLRVYRPILPYLLMIILALLTLPELAFTDRILARGDTFAYFYPYWDTRQLALSAGQLPLWTPDIFMGAPLLANPQIGTFYPLNWLPFNAPDAVRYSIMLHVILAGMGTYALAKRLIGHMIPGIAAACLYMLGGMIGGHIEQINQLQGLAWLPWLVLIYHQVLVQPRWGRWLLLLAVAWALQIFSGHTQTTFMTGVTLALYGLTHGLQHAPRLKHSFRALSLLGIGTLIAALLALPQLGPTMELSGLSNRSTFDVYAVTAFSLPLNYLPRALLPSYDGQLFTEYLGYIGIIGMGLALLGALLPQPNATPRRWPWLLMTVIGLLLALGRYTPLYWVVGELPGFDLFRVPARWLALYSLGAAILSGMGLQALLRGVRPGPTALSVILLLLSGLMLTARFVTSATIDPTEIVGPMIPTSITMLGWVLALLGLLLLIFLAARIERWQGLRRIGASLVIVALVAGELIAAGLILPHHDLAPRDVYLSPSLTANQLAAYNEDEIVPPRILPVSLLNFDPGNRDTLAARYATWGLDQQAIFTAFVALKKQEMLFPNLPLTWDIPSVDGFGGGVLPTSTYTQFTSLLLPEGTFERAIDGRLGERLATADCRGVCMPDDRYLNMVDAGYLVADKTFDLPIESVFYDMSLSMPWQAISMQVAPTFQATELHLLLPADSPLPTGDVHIIGENTQETIALESAEAATFDVFTRLILTFDEPRDITAIDINDTPEAITLYAATLVDSRTGSYWQVPLDSWLRVLSSDIKIYERENPLGRAFIVGNAISVPDTWAGTEEALNHMREPDFDPAQTVILHRDGLLDAVSADGSTGRQAEITLYEDTRVEIEVMTEAGGYLVLSDAHYPGWQATIDGEATTLYRANAMFRAVDVPPGAHTVVFSFVPNMWYASMGIGLAAWALTLIAFIGLIWWRARA